MSAEIKRDIRNPPVRSNKFYFKSIFVQVEDETFRVPRHRLEAESGVFQPLPPGTFQELHAPGLTEECPIVFSGCSKREFELLLNTLYPLSRKDTLAGFVREWDVNLTPSLRIRLGRTFGVQEWIMSGYRDLVGRNDPLNAQEIEALGSQSSARVCRFREQRWRNDQFSPALDSTVIKLERGENQLSVTTVAMAGRSLPKNAKPPRRNPVYFLEDIVLQVENTLYRLPQSRFRTGSRAFHDMLALPQGHTTSVEGLDDNNPIVLHGIASSDFDHLLEVLFPRAEEPPNFNYHEWSRVARLADMWSFEDVMTLAIQEMSPMLEKDSTMIVEQIMLAQQYKVKKWLVDGCARLVNRDLAPTLCERRKIGFELLIFVSELRDRSFKFVRGGLTGTRYSRHVILPSDVEVMLADTLTRMTR